MVKTLDPIEKTLCKKTKPLRKNSKPLFSIAKPLCRIHGTISSNNSRTAAEARCRLSWYARSRQSPPATNAVSVTVSAGVAVRTVGDG